MGNTAFGYAILRRITLAFARSGAPRLAIALLLAMVVSCSASNRPRRLGFWLGTRLVPASPRLRVGRWLATLPAPQKLVAHLGVVALVGAAVLSSHAPERAAVSAPEPAAAPATEVAAESSFVLPFSPGRPPEFLLAPARLALRVPAALASLTKLPDGPQPSGQGDSSAKDSPGKVKSPFKYTVAPGDTVSGIAQRFGVTTETVMTANEIYNPNALSVGRELTILPVSGVVHTIESGDNLNYIGRLYGVSAETIAEYNGIEDPGTLKVGTKMVVPEGRILMARATGSSRGNRPPAAEGGASGILQWPTVGRITQYFGGGHTGIDIAVNHGTPIYAADGGLIVTALKVNYGYGYHLIIDHGNGYKTLYSHLSAFYADYGEKVGKGERIGAAGSTGLSTGPHLHFEVFQNGVRVNPLSFLP